MKPKAQATKNARSSAVVARAKAPKGKKTIASKVKASTPLEVAATELFGNDAEAAASHGVKLGKRKKAAAKPTPTPTPATEAVPAAPAKREGKGAMILRLIGRDQGATLAEIMSATNWLAHSVRGFISTASKKRVIESRKNEASDRTYKLVE
jgi:hypothetical protein